MNFTEDQLEEAYLEILQELEWEHINGRHMEREDYHEIILEENLRNAIYSLNKDMPNSAKEEAIRKVLHLSTPNLIKTNDTCCCLDRHFCLFHCVVRYFLYSRT